MSFVLVQIISQLGRKFQMFTLFWRMREALQHGSSILSSNRTFKRISQLQDNAHTLNLENRLYLSSMISQLPDFVRYIMYMIFDFIFCVTMNTLYFDIILSNPFCLVSWAHDCDHFFAPYTVYLVGNPSHALDLPQVNVMS